MGLDLEKHLLIKEFVEQSRGCLIMKGCAVIPTSIYEKIKHTFSIDVTGNLSKILGKNYLIRYDYKEPTAFFLGDIYLFVVYKKDKPIYFESYDVTDFYVNKTYYPIFWEWEENYNRYVCHLFKNHTKPLFFDIKHFWWRLNLKKAKTFLNEKVY